MKAELVSIGDELLIGQVVNTNAAWLGERLSALGVDVVRVTTLGDDAEAIGQSMEQALGRTDLVVITGGLGPTHDDVTKKAVADRLGIGLVFDEEVFEQVRARFARRGRTMAPSNRGQAMVPEGFEVLPNAHGTAPGLWRTAPDAASGHLVILPGVPFEMKALMDEHVVPRLTGRRAAPVRITLLSTGIGESALQERLGDLLPWMDHGVRLAYLPGIEGVRLRISSDAAQAERARDLVAHIEREAGSYLYGREGDLLEAVVGRLLAERSLTVATAESCTGGLVASRLTDVPGASAYVLGGVVAYANQVKETLGVDAALLDRDGAVSRSVVSAMATRVRAFAGADVGMATSGILGPGGGTDEKPVGTVWIAVDVAGVVRPVLLRLGGSRDRNKRQAATAVLNLLRQTLLRMP